MGSVVLNKVNGLMSVHFYPQENMKIKKEEAIKNTSILAKNDMK